MEQRLGNRQMQSLRNMDVKVATWNVQTTLQTGMMRKYDIGIIAIREIRWHNLKDWTRKTFPYNRKRRYSAICEGCTIEMVKHVERVVQDQRKVMNSQLIGVRRKGNQQDVEDDLR